MPRAKIMINRAPVLNLWTAVVAERLGYKKGEALGLSKALTGQTAQRHAQELGISEASEENVPKGNKKKTGAVPLRFLGKDILVVDTPDGIRAVSKDKPIEPETVEKYLKSKFGDDLPRVRAAMESLAKSVPPKEVRAKAYVSMGSSLPRCRLNAFVVLLPLANTMENNLPPEFEPLLTELADAPENVRVMWRYAIVLAMIDDEKARVLETHQEGETQHIVVQTLSGDRFEVVRPPMSNETERLLLEQIRAILTDEE